jgi:hypothetical protein
LPNDPLGLQGQNRGGEGRKDEKEKDDYRKKTVGLQRGKYKAPLKKERSTKNPFMERQEEGSASIGIGRARQGELNSILATTDSATENPERKKPDSRMNLIQR